VIVQHSDLRCFIPASACEPWHLAMPITAAVVGDLRVASSRLATLTCRRDCLAATLDADSLQLARSDVNRALALITPSGPGGSRKMSAISMRG